MATPDKTDQLKSILGMKVFEFEEKTTRLIVAGNFWIFVVLAASLMTITLMTWMLAVRQRKGKISSNGSTA